RMLLAASHHHCLAEMLVVAAFLEGQDPRERPTDAQQQAAEKHSLFKDARSDFITVLNIWRAYNEQSATLSRNQLRKWCREHFLSFLRMREWQDLHTQLAQAIAELKLRPNQMPANYTDLHQAILTGFLGSIGELDEKREYNGVRGMRFVIAPGTPLASKPPKWIVAGSIVETTRLYARMVAAVDPGWIEAAAAHLVKRSYSEPHWVETRGHVSAYESVSLYGLTLAARRRVNYGAIAPREAREMFIREALIAPTAPDHERPSEEYDWEAGRGSRSHANRQPPRNPRNVIQGDFLEANRRLRAEVEELEAKIRRRDVLVDDERQLEFYSARIPERVNSVNAFNHWRAEAERGNPRLLYMSRSDLMQRDAAEADAARFPNTLPVGGNQLPLLYVFEPAEPNDGVTLVVPEPLLDAVSAEQIAWLVPGMRLEKIIAVFRALPKGQRKLLVPVPDSAGSALDDAAAEESRLGRLPGFHEWLAKWVTQRIGSPVTAHELASLPIPDNLRMNLRVLDATDRVLAEGRDLLAIKRKLYAPPAVGSAPVRTPPPLVPAAAPVALHRQWDFGDLPECREVERNRLRLIIYPAIEDKGAGGVAVTEARNLHAAEAMSRVGMVRLAMLGLVQQAKYVGKRVADDRELVLLSRGLTFRQSLSDALTQRAFRECFFPDDVPMPRTAQDFNRILDQRRSLLSDVADRLAVTVASILKEWRAARVALDGLRANASFREVVAEMDSQLGLLLPADFIESTPRPWLDYLPRYLKAVARRAERLPPNMRKDAEMAAKVRPFTTALRSLLAEPAVNGTRPEVDLLRWMIEEFRVSLFAQDLKTMLRVSEKRLAEQLSLARDAQR
ncbi:MAG TPA: DUF3418 domain-containing protein, partial [Steroidobacteraceae bacterium]|nr:DUF3418 domain-containing protein [Steroidobacteraceae bacterium]